MVTRLVAVQEILGHGFTDPALLLRACTHASHCESTASTSDRLAEANERLEFIGDALLGAAVALRLATLLPEADEGELSRHKSRLVSRRNLARAMERSGLLAHCRVGPQLPPPWPDSVKANLAEGVLAAIHLDGGWSALCGAVDRLLGDLLVDDEAPAGAGGACTDARNRLQSWALQNHKQLPSYSTWRSGGSDHAPEFTCTVCIAGCQASASGGSRRRAEAAAAAALLAQQVDGAVDVDNPLT